ncbi:MAG: enoyl-CoA hydratase-related protein, partial [Thermomicrobiales bacterium]
IRHVGLRHAIELTIFPRLVPAQRAYEMGLVNWVVPKGQELAKALEVADAILECGPAAVRAFIESYYRCYGMEHFNAVKLAGHIQKDLSRMEDAKEGPRAFAEKRRPNFQNR